MRVNETVCRPRHRGLLVPENHKLLKPKLKLSKLLAYAMDALLEAEKDEAFQVDMTFEGILAIRGRQYTVSLPGALMAKCLPVRLGGQTRAASYQSKVLRRRLEALFYIQQHKLWTAAQLFFEPEPPEKQQICFSRVEARLTLEETDPTNPLPQEWDYAEHHNNWWRWMVSYLHYLQLEGL